MDSFEKVTHVKTLKDCYQCEFIGQCDKWYSRGTWKHREGKNPCLVISGGN